ncbi:BA14K family protein [Rhizobium glycinendophyticum]|uniref:Lectin-like protein BA14k n=1 Tax=Rhizobium glycinendophyticum TaxID=2589807 RepID=A0A504USB2_9HYPH|nr:BA14K family protein [Rhizobium glycinendophyticum]TPP11586.1 BA14K family protein [Rhizobium glycinendophyticum]
MMKFAQNAFLAAAVTLVPMAAATQAEAGDRYYRHHRHNDALALGALGLATGVIVGSVLASPPPQRRVYVDQGPVSVYDDQDYYVDDYPPPPPQRRPVYRPQPVYQSYAIEPWTGAWHQYCSQRYRSFNPRTGTYIGYDGQSHFCTAG